MPETWAPTLADVARHIPTRTRDVKTPGSDTMLGTFNPHTTPSGAQAQAVIDDAVASVLAAVGTLPSSPPASDQIQVQARVAAEWRAAADIEIAYPNRDADVRVAAALDVRAKDALATLVTGLNVETEGPVDLLPYWAFPVPVKWGDDPLY
jgi:hypothetical protein